MLRINDVLFRQARAESDNYHTAVTEALMQMMQLLTWAQKVETLAEGEGHGMSDDEIEEAVEGARDLLCWFQDDEGIDEFDGL